jgi:hypothetical protein
MTEDNKLQFQAILKQIKVTNNDTDSYISITLSVNNSDILNTLNLNNLYLLKHKVFKVILEES